MQWFVKPLSWSCCAQCHSQVRHLLKATEFAEFRQTVNFVALRPLLAAVRQSIDLRPFLSSSRRQFICHVSTCRHSKCASTGKPWDRPNIETRCLSSGGSINSGVWYLRAASRTDSISGKDEWQTTQRCQNAARIPKYS